MAIFGRWNGASLYGEITFDEDKAFLDKDGPNWKIESRQVIHTHSPSACDGGACCIHNPSNHHMRDWPLVHRMDRQVITFSGMKLTMSERTCEHGIGHPDPDSLDYLAQYSNRDSWAIHGCDGCCRPSSRKSATLAGIAEGLRVLAEKKQQRVYGRNEQGLAREAQSA